MEMKVRREIVLTHPFRNIIRVNGSTARRRTALQAGGGRRVKAQTLVDDRVQDREILDVGVGWYIALVGGRRGNLFSQLILPFRMFGQLPE